MTRLIDADALMRDIERYHLSDGKFQHWVEVQPTIDAVSLDGSFLKMSKGGYVIYQRKWLYEHLEQEFDILRSASGMPTVETEPVRHGKWIEKSTGGEHFDCCSECGYVEWDAPNNYCPHCGARMDADE